MKRLSNGMKTVFYTTAMVLVLLGAMAILDKNNDFSLTQRESAHKFGATYMTMNNPFFEVINGTIRATVESNGDILITRDPALDAERQTQQIYDLIDEGVEAIFIAPVDFEKIIPAIEYGREKGVRIIFVDTEIYDESLADCIVVSDNYHAGVLCAEYLLHKKTEGKILIFEHPTTKSSNDRVEGFADTVEGNGNFEIVDRLDYAGQLEIAMPLMIDELKKGVDLCCFFHQRCGRSWRDGSAEGLRETGRHICSWGGRRAGGEVHDKRKNHARNVGPVSVRNRTECGGAALQYDRRQAC